MPMIRTTSKQDTTHQPRRVLNMAGRLMRLECAAAAPIAVGELYDWSDRLQSQLFAVESKFADWSTTQRALHAEVRRRDPALCHRIDRLEQRMNTSADDLALLSSAVTTVASSDVGAYAAAADIRETLLGWILEMRSLEREATTWWTEALYRDRGIAD